MPYIVLVGLNMAVKPNPSFVATATHMSCMEGAFFIVSMFALASVAIVFIIYAHKRQIAKETKDIEPNDNALEKL